MNLKAVFTQEDLHLILPSKIALAIDQIAAETGEDPVELLPKFYASEVYAKLKDESTKYWWFGPAELKELYLRERASGLPFAVGKIADGVHGQTENAFCCRKTHHETYYE